jgi:hypothetical protein
MATAMQSDPDSDTTLDSPLLRYFAAVDASDFPKVVSLFAPASVYIRPRTPVPGEPPLTTMELIRGREALQAFFDGRGPMPIRHAIRVSVVEGHRCFVEGDATVDGHPDLRDIVFMATADFDDDGLITRYLAVPMPVTVEIAEEIAASRVV